MLRDFLNAILSFIGSTSLTDDEFESVESTHPIYDQGTYDDLARVLQDRENVSIFQERLIKYYEAKGVDVAPRKTATSNIFIGSPL